MSVNSAQPIGPHVSVASAGKAARPAVLAQMAMAAILLVYVLLGVKSFIDARRART